MKENSPKQDPTPPDCFRQAEVEAFQLFEDQPLGTVHYYVWRQNSKSAFLYAIELYFENGDTLLLSSGEASDGIRIIAPESLVATAQKLKELHGEAMIQRIVANMQPLWRDVIGAKLLEIQLTRHESGLYSNEAILLDFGSTQILLELSEKDGLELGEY
jgi:hypothetical protein